MTTITIHDIADLGDGVGSLPDGSTVFVARTATGDVVQISPPERTAQAGLRATLEAVITPSPDRVTPPCAHYERCGGCQLQHVAAPAYAAFKQQRLLRWVRALHQPESVLHPLWITPPNTRRRTSMQLRKQHGEWVFGFQTIASHETLNVPECQLLDPALRATMNSLRTALLSIKKPVNIQSMQATQTAHGSDVLVHANAPLKAAELEALNAWAAAENPVRLCVQPEGKPAQRIAGQNEATITFSDGSVAALPVGSFLQATQAAEAMMSATVSTWLQPYQTIAEFYCGIGTFTLPLLRAGKQLRAWEGSQEAIHALHNAARGAGFDHALHAETRDLYKRPIQPDALNGCDGILINPPRNGALPQMQAIARSSAPCVVMVSCNPASSLRDAQALIAQGYRLTALQGIDQFLWSAHIELIARFERT